MKNRIAVLVCVLCVAVSANVFAQEKSAGKSAVPTWKNPKLPIAQRVNDLISRMTLEEKISQLTHVANGIPRLGVPAYNWWNEGLHGVGRAGYATVFPQAIGMAATFDEPLMHEAATVISTEFRAKYYANLKPDGSSDWYHGLTVWSPNINIFRDPRWGRGQETYGEDPYLTSRMAVAFITGLQGENPKYLKVLATAKHFAAYSGPEPARHSIDVKPSAHDLEDTYLPAFRASVREAKVGSIMCSYNAVDGAPSCANDMLLQKYLRKDWGFKGYVVSDCGAVQDVWDGHHYAKSMQAAEADSFRAGTDLVCAWPEQQITFNRDTLLQAVKQGLLPEKSVDNSLRLLFTARMKLGMFDPPSIVPYSNIKPSENDTEAHRELALKAARESIVLLKNENHFLPLKGAYKTIAVIGPDAKSLDAIEGNYNGTPSKPVTILDGIRKRFSQSKVVYTEGTGLVGPSDSGGSDAIATARDADLVILVMGLSPRIEGEEMKFKAEGFLGGDRTKLSLPAAQEDLVKKIAALGKPTVLVLMNGGALAVNWSAQHLPAIIEAWYPGEEGGTAVAEALAGDFSPAGRLPVTFYTGVAQLPAFEDYSMANRTYRYFKGEPLFPFGYGLSYTSFAYRHATVSLPQLAAGSTETVSVDVSNTGSMAGDEVVELYLTHPDVPGAPLRALEGFQRIHLAPGESKTVSFMLHPRQLSTVDPSGKRRIAPGKVEVWIGGGQPVTPAGLPKPAGAATQFTITSAATLPD
ncbi:MAG TPA: glycoside hydrolase family 3 C-terminal domain-containing protein [Candidatus Acidoferrales bacterium]|nr:glycoside hydrolase family 3 C-terminal domain-containing protein [Candidatus Acidoferrales bacterium]